MLEDVLKISTSDAMKTSSFQLSYHFNDLLYGSLDNLCSVQEVTFNHYHKCSKYNYFIKKCNFCLLFLTLYETCSTVYLVT